MANIEDYRVFVSEDYDGNHEYIIIKASNVTEGKAHDLYNSYGQQDYDCDYDIYEDDFRTECLSAINEEFELDFIEDGYKHSFYAEDYCYGLTADEEDEPLAYKFLEEHSDELHAFMQKYVEECTYCPDATYYTYWDGHNNRSIAFYIENNDWKDAELLDEDDEVALDILNEYVNGDHYDYEEWGTGHGFNSGKWHFGQSYYEDSVGIYGVTEIENNEE